MSENVFESSDEPSPQSDRYFCHCADNAAIYVHVHRSATWMPTALNGAMQPLLPDGCPKAAKR